MDSLTDKEQLEIYSLAKEELKNVESRMERIDDKATHQFTILAILLAFASVGLNTFAEKIVNWPNSFFEILFLISYLLLLCVVFTCLLKLINLLKSEDFKVVAVSDDLIKFFKKLSYEKSIQRLTHDYLHCIEDNEKILAEKTEKMETSRKHVIYIIALTIITTIFYIIVVAKDHLCQTGTHPTPGQDREQQRLETLLCPVQHSRHHQ